MPSSLTSNHINSEAQHRANILTNNPDLVKVLVEDEVDVVIWKRILKSSMPDKNFDVQAYSHDPADNGKGKAHILAKADEFGEYSIGCVDSDNDWLLQDYTTEGHIIKSCGYIFQTYTYSIENLAAHPVGVSDCMLECCMHTCDLHRNLDSDFQSFIESLSESVYEPLIWHLTLLKKGNYSNKIARGWDELFGNGHYHDITTSTDITFEDKRIKILERLQNQASALVNNYKTSHPELIPSYENLKAELLASKNLTPENAYLYVRGHNLHDFLICNFFKPVENHIKSIHRANIIAKYDAEARKSLLNHYKKILKAFDLNYIHRHAYLSDKTNPNIQRIKADIIKVFSDV